MLALARSALALSVLAATTGTASAAPSGTVDVPLPPPPAGTALVRTTSVRTVLVSGKAGIALPLGNGGDGAPMVEVEAALPWRTTSSGVALSWALPLRTMLPSKGDHDGLEFGSTGLELTPTLRASVPLGRSTVSLRTDAGLGVVSRWTWTQIDTRFLGRRTETGQSTTGLVRMGLALDWAVSPKLSIDIEPLSLGYDFKGNADWVIAGGATYRL